MANQQIEQCDIGMVGLGVMGRNFLLNMADNGYSVAGYDLDQEKADSLRQEAEARSIHATTDLAEFMGALRKPRAIMMLVPAGKAVDAVINSLLPYLDKGDLVIDAGNSFFKDTDARQRALEDKGLHFFGMGVSGGEKGARHGPSMMPGGPKAAYERVREIFEAASAKVNGEPCVTYLGPRSAGHFVKMVHNGIEYGIMQLLAESYDLMKRGLGMSNAQLHATYAAWDKAELKGYLTEITRDIFAQPDKKSGGELIDQILAVARQKGTGAWTSQSALALQVPTPTIDMAVAMRDLSVLMDERAVVGKLYPQPIMEIAGDKEAMVQKIGEALLAAIVIAYAQGMALLTAASKAYEYDLNLEAVARIWRGGCIIRSTLLEDIMAAYRQDNTLANFLLAPSFTDKLQPTVGRLRSVVVQAAQLGIPVPALGVSLAYFDALRSSWSPANLIQAQRDYFGSHTYERIDESGVFHTQWGE